MLSEPFLRPTDSYRLPRYKYRLRTPPDRPGPRTAIRGADLWSIRQWRARWIVDDRSAVAAVLDRSGRAGAVAGAVAGPGSAVTRRGRNWAPAGR